MSGIPFFLALDDEKSVGALHKVISKIYPKSEIYTSSAGDEAWKLIKKENKIGIIITSTVLPGLTGWQLLANVRDNTNLKESYVIFISTAVDNDKNIKALQQGADDFLRHPFSLDQIIAKLRSAERILNLKQTVEENIVKIEKLQQDIQKNLDSMVDQITEFIDVRMPDAKAKAIRIYDASVWIARKLGDINENEINKIGAAAKLCFSGRLCLPENLLNVSVMKHGIPTNDIMRQVPPYSKKLLSKISGYDDVIYILYHIFENFDGTGIPENKKSWQIPIGSRIIRTGIDYEESYIENKQVESKAMEALYHDINRLYDFKIVSLFDQFLANYGINKGKETAVSSKEITEGMILTRNLTTESGLRLLSAGLALNAESIEKIKEIKRVDPIIGDIYVRVR